MGEAGAILESADVPSSTATYSNVVGPQTPHETTIKKQQQQQQQQKLNLESLPVELLLHIFSYIGCSQLFPLKLAGSRYITNVIRNHTTVSFATFLADYHSHLPPGSIKVSHAAKDGHEALVRRLLRDSQSLGDYYLVVGLHDAAENGHVGILRLFAEHGADIYRTESRGPFSFPDWPTPRCTRILPIHRAARNGHGEAVVALLELSLEKERKKSSLTARILHKPISKTLDPSSYWPNVLHIAAANGDIKTASLILAHGVDVNNSHPCKYCKNKMSPVRALMRCRADQGHGTALHVAAERDQVTMIDFLVRNGARVNAKGEGAETPLERAASLGKENAVRALLRNKASVLDRKFPGSSALCLAISSGHDTIVKLILLHQKSNSHSMKYYQEYPIHHALGSGNTNLIQLLLSHGAVVSMSSLEQAAKYADYNLFKLLLDHTDRKQIEKKSNYSGLLATIGKYGRVDIFRHVLDMRGGVESFESEHLSTAMYNAGAHGHADLLQACFELQLSQSARVALATSALQGAAWCNQQKSLELILQEAPEIDTPRETFWSPQWHYSCTPLHVASGRGNGTTVRLLLDHKASLTARCGAGGTSLHYAAQFGNSAVMFELCSRGADLNAVNENGDTPLHLAVKAFSFHGVKLLLKLGAEVNTRNKAGHTPFSYVAAYYEELPMGRDAERCLIYNELEEHGASIDELDGEWITLEDILQFTPPDSMIRQRGPFTRVYRTIL